MLTIRPQLKTGPIGQYNLLETISFKIYEALPRILPYTPNAMYMNHVCRPYTNIAWHSDYRVQFPHSKQYRMLRAITTDNLKQIKELLKSPNFKIDQPIDKKYGYNALQFAALLNQFTVIQMLLMYGANINKQDKYGNTPLMYAVDKHNLESINSLMKNGCDRHQRNKYGIDPVQKAKSKINQEYLVEFLQGYPDTPRRFPKFRVKLAFEDKLNHPLWDYVKKYKIYQNRPKLYPFNNFKGTYRINMTPFKTVQKVIQFDKIQRLKFHSTQQQLKGKKNSKTGSSK